MDSEPDIPPAAAHEEGPQCKRAKRTRKSRASKRKMPKDEGPEDGGQFRTTEAERTMMVQIVLKALTPREAALVRLTGDFPTNAHSRLNAAYRSARAHVIYYRNLAATAKAKFAAHTEVLDGDAGDAGSVSDSGSVYSDHSDHSTVYDGVSPELKDVWIEEVRACSDEPPEPPAAALPSHNAVKQKCKRWTKRMLTHGNVRDLPPCVAGAKREKRKPVLAQIHDKIHRGWPDVSGRFHAYFSLDDLERRDRRAFAADAAKPEHQRELVGQKPYHELREEMGIQANRYVWRDLKAEYPNLRYVKHSMRRARNDRPAVMVRRRALLKQRMQCWACASACKEKCCACWSDCSSHYPHVNEADRPRACAAVRQADPRRGEDDLQQRYPHGSASN